MTETDLTTMPPQNIEAEQALLGSMILDNRQIAVAIDIIGEGEFYKEAHQVIYKTILGLFERGDPTDGVTVMSALDSSKMLEKCGGAAYLSTLMECTPTPTNADAYARAVHDKHILRQMIRAAHEIQRLAYDGERDQTVDEIVAEAEGLILGVTAAKRETSKTFSMKQGLDYLIKILQKRFDNRGTPIGIPTGLKDLDFFIGGFQDTDMVVVAARPSMGKTSLALNIARENAFRRARPVALFSLEMSLEQLMMRMVSAESRIEGHKMRTGFLCEDEWARVYCVTDKTSAAPLWIVDNPGMSMLDLRAKGRRLKQEKNIGLVVIDYMQLVTGRGRGNRTEEVSEISRGMKIMARELGVPVVVVSQLSRACEQRPDKRPILSDLKESGSIEQDADIIMSLYRESYYGQEQHHGDGLDVTEVIVGKHRNGPTGKINVGFLKRIAAFVDLDQETGGNYGTRG